MSLVQWALPGIPVKSPSQKERNVSRLQKSPASSSRNQQELGPKLLQLSDAASQCVASLDIPDSATGLISLSGFLYYGTAQTAIVGNLNIEYCDSISLGPSKRLYHYDYDSVLVYAVEALW
jgi:hypothetical protein